MPIPTTTMSYDAVAQVSERLFDRALKALWVEEIIPHEAQEDFDHMGFKGRGWVSFLPPSISFDVAAPMLENPVKVSFPIRATVNLTSPSKDAFTVNAEIEVTAEVKNQTHKDGNSIVHYITVEFAQVPSNQFKASIEESSYSIFQDLLAHLVEVEIKRLYPIPLGPPVPATEVNGKRSISAYRASVLNDTTPQDLDCMNLLVMLGNKTSAPDVIVKPFLGVNEDYAVAISEGIFNKMLAEALQEQFPQGFPTRLPKPNSDITLNWLEIELDDGYLAVKGSATKSIDCFPDPTVPFSAKVYLALSPQGHLDAKAKDEEVDLPWWCHLFNFLLPGITEIVLAGTERSVEFTLGRALETQAGSLLRNISMFANKLPADATPVAPSVPLLDINNTRIEVRADALIIGGYILLYWQEDEAKSYIGNLNTGELHLAHDAPYDDYSQCEWGWRTAQYHRVMFAGVLSALRQGYNGCWYCLRRYDTDQFQASD